MESRYRLRLVLKSLMIIIAIKPQAIILMPKDSRLLLLEIILTFKENSILKI
jgi:hypothetical protein